MKTVRRTVEFDGWLGGLRDAVARARITARITRLASGLTGDVKPVGNAVSELRIDHGPGYRVYFVQRGDILVILLWGGEKGSQKRDIAKAQAMAASMGD